MFGVASSYSVLPPKMAVSLNLCNEIPFSHNHLFLLSLQPHFPHLKLIWQQFPNLTPTLAPRMELPNLVLYSAQMVERVLPFLKPNLALAWHLVGGFPLKCANLTSRWKWFFFFSVERKLKSILWN